MRIDLAGSTFDVDASLLSASPDEVRRQVREYAAGERRTFDVPVAYPDTFTGRVMEAVRAIPYGETRSYGDLGASLETAPIAVGGACGRNPVPPIVPCHRVLASDGSLRGYSADGGVAVKRRLLVMEAEQSTDSSRSIGCH